MADRKEQPAIEGETRFGPHDPNQKTAQGIFYIPSSNLPGKGSVLAMDAVDNTGACTTHYLFIGSDSVLRISTTAPSNTNTDGSAV